MKTSMLFKTFANLLLYSILVFSSVGHGKIGTHQELARAVEAAVALNNADISQNYKQLESLLDQAIQEDPTLSAKAPAVALSIAEQYLQSGRIQEAIWALDRGGAYSFAEDVTQTMAKLLAEMPLTNGMAVGKGVSHSFFGKIGNVAVVVKPEDKAKSYDSEVWSYQLDRMLGFNLIPLAVKREINGKPYSVHMMITGAQDSGLNFRDSGYKQEHSDFYFLDYLIDQVDRHYQNSMFAPNGRLFAIDHGRVHGTSGQIKFSAFDARLKPSNQMINNLKNTNVEKFKSELLKFAPEAVVQFISARLLEIQDSLKDVIALGAIRPLLVEERLNKPNDNAEAAVIDLKKFKEQQTKIQRQQLQLQKQQQQQLDEQRRQEIVDYRKGINALNLLEADENRNKDYIKQNGYKLTENGHRFLILIKQGDAVGFQGKDALLLIELIKTYNAGKLGFRDFRRLYAELLDRKISVNFLNISRSQFKEIAPLHLFFADEDFQKKYQDGEKISETFKKNYESISAGLPKGLSCRFVYR